MDNDALIQQHLSDLKAEYGDIPTSRVARERRRAERAAVLEAAKVNRERSRREFEEGEKRWREKRARLLAECADPDYGRAFEFLHEHLTRKRCQQYAVVGAEAIAFHQSGELPRAPAYGIFGYPTYAHLKLHIDLLGRGDNVFNNTLIAYGVRFYLQGIRTKRWVSGPTTATVLCKNGAAVSVPIINSKYCRADGKWYLSNMRYYMDLLEKAAAEQWDGQVDT